MTSAANHFSVATAVGFGEFGLHRVPRIPGPARFGPLLAPQHGRVRGTVHFCDDEQSASFDRGRFPTALPVGGQGAAESD